MRTKKKSPLTVRAELRRAGVTVAHWARENNVSPRLVYAVLEGRAKGHYGQSHTIAVLLGLKDGVVRGGR